MTLAETTLHRLLDRAERALLTGSGRTIRESFTSIQSPYWQQSLDVRVQMHALLRDVEKRGAVKLEWASQGGQDRPLNGVVFADLNKLATYLNRDTSLTRLTAAVEILAPWRQNERVEQLLETWSQLKNVRALGPESATDFADALRVIDTMRDANEDRVVRQVSVELFSDSKRIEALRKHLDVLTSESLSAMARHWSEVYACIGLTKEPQPFLLAGGGEVRLTASMPCPLVKPFVGVSCAAIEGYAGKPEWLLTVENLTTFHQVALLLVNRVDGLVLFTGGMPSPRWLRAYANILASLPEATTIYHWGDHDEGGFRIAATLGRRTIIEGRTLRPWLMGSTDCSPKATVATPAQQRAMARNADVAGWKTIAVQMPSSLYEQEGLVLRLPTSGGTLPS